ncbi:MAG: IS21 family transposase [Bacillota bacterium]|nr:IS21 family transposase [Bacillota bacterium]
MNVVNYREILRLRSLSHSQRQVAISSGCSRETVSTVYKLADKLGIEWPLPEDWSNEKLRDLFYPGGAESKRRMPDCAAMFHEMAKPGVTLTLLWAEYCEQCHAEKVIPLKYTQFCDHYRKYVNTTKATMRIKREPGEIMEVDWAGKTLSVHDRHTGEIVKAYIFVAVLPCSLYAYVEAFPSMESANWIAGHVSAYEFFGGVTRMLVPDNAKVGITKHTRQEVILNKTYAEMAEHYGTCIMPARPSKPKDKPSVEGSVGVITTWIIAALRHYKAFSFTDLNDAIREKLDEINRQPFQKKPGSRLSAFMEEEKTFLIALPASPYEVAVWSTANIQPEYTITIDENKYSVPYILIGHEVDIRTSSKTIEIFFQGSRVASHVRRHEVQADPVMLPEHMPENHRRYLAYHSDNFKDWAEQVGPSTMVVIQSFLTAGKVEQQGYKSCSRLMKLADKHSTTRIEDACCRALAYTPDPSIKTIEAILKTGQDRVKQETQAPKSDSTYAFTRGSEYFGGKLHD